MRGLNRATLGAFVVDEDRCPCIELLLDLADFCRHWEVLDAVVGPLAGHERFDDPAQGFRTEQMVGNNHRGETPSLCTESALCTSGSALLVLELFVSRSGWRAEARPHHVTLLTNLFMPTHPRSPHRPPRGGSRGRTPMRLPSHHHLEYNRL